MTSKAKKTKTAQAPAEQPVRKPNLLVLVTKTCHEWRVQNKSGFASGLLNALDKYISECDSQQLSRITLPDADGIIQVKRSTISNALRRSKMKPVDRERVIANYERIAEMALRFGACAAYPKKTISPTHLEKVLPEISLWITHLDSLAPVSEEEAPMEDEEEEEEGLLASGDDGDEEEEHEPSEDGELPPPPSGKPKAAPLKRKAPASTKGPAKKRAKK